MTRLVLDPKLDLSKVGALNKSLLAAKGDDLEIDAGQVTLLGALGLQVLIASAKTWRDSGQTLTISPRSEFFDEALELFGVTVDDLQSTEAV